MPRLYRTGNGMWRSSEREIRSLARQHRTSWEPIDVATGVKGLLAFLNGQRGVGIEAAAPPPPPMPKASEGAGPAGQAPSPGAIDVRHRALAAVREFVRGRKRATSREIENHLRDEQRIAAGRLWIGEMLRRLGWVVKQAEAGRFYVPAEAPPRDLASGDAADTAPDLLTAAERVLACPSVKPYLLTSPYDDLAAAVAETKAEAAQ